MPEVERSDRWTGPNLPDKGPTAMETLGLQQRQNSSELGQNRSAHTTQYPALGQGYRTRYPMERRLHLGKVPFCCYTGSNSHAKGGIG